MLLHIICMAKSAMYIHTQWDMDTMQVAMTTVLCCMTRQSEHLQLAMHWQQLTVWSYNKSYLTAFKSHLVYVHCYVQLIPESYSA